MPATLVDDRAIVALGLATPIHEEADDVSVQLPIAGRAEVDAPDQEIGAFATVIGGESGQGDPPCVDAAKGALCAFMP